MVSCTTDRQEKSCDCGRPSYRAYLILRFAFTIAPIIAGLDKFFNVLTRWEQYLAPQFNLVGTPYTTMMVIGIIEIVVGILVWVKPRIFAYVVAVWLFGIIVNLLVLGNFYDIALRDFGLLLGALALGCLSREYCCEKGMLTTPKKTHRE